jgi:hypothetical protein
MERKLDNHLLAHLSYRLTTQHEVIVTEGLTYILQQSSICRKALHDIVLSFECELPETLRFYSELTGENLERPDVVGLADDGQERFIIEGKFEAGLTDNQPNNYLTRLLPENDGMLLFAVPELRVENLWRELLDRAGQKFSLSNQRDLSDGSKSVDINTHHKLGIISWENVLNGLLHPAQRQSDQIAGDILQLLSLCNRIEGESFNPISSEELTSKNLPKRHRDFCNLVDAITEKLLEANLISLKGLRATPQREAYTRYFRYGDDKSKIIASIKLDYSAWLETELSPLWLECWPDSHENMGNICKQYAIKEGITLLENKSTYLLPFHVEPLAEFNEIVDAAFNRTKGIIPYLEELSGDLSE